MNVIACNLDSNTILQQQQNITAVGTVTSYRFDNPEGVDRFPTDLRNFTQIRAPPRLLFSRYSGLAPDCSPPSSTKVKTELCYTSCPPISLHAVHRDKLSG
jgi:hypothetical protein